ncbi:Olfactory receptor 52D1 [Camelus dromedarius]|uniref:Olfactory receptor 52D1 n=1 Tax=Camelus dromedarius TaxID=9838 RepID=A0A5N4DP88_CAMDR|nr:Olfactory receptor 52D1 [Camelus dromedarius]
MEFFNSNIYKPFLLTGFPGLEDSHPVISILFCALYPIALMGNTTILVFIQVEESLHAPMYLFLSMLAASDLGLCAATLSTLLKLFWFDILEIDFACLIQMFFIHVFSLMKSGILLTMAFERYVAISNPLRYTTILTNSTIAKTDIIKLSCSDHRMNSSYGLIILLTTFGVDSVLILLSYLKILVTVLDLGHLSVTTSNSASARLIASLLTGVPGLEDFQIWISIPFSFMCLLAVTGNGLVMAVVAWDRSLHEPMYLSLAMLALNDVLLCTVTVPKMLLIFWQGPSPSTFPACLTQMFFVHALFLSESAVLLAMAFDRYVAICAHLHYATLLTGSLISKVGLALVARSVVVVIPGVLLILRLYFCRSNVIRHTYCENMGIAKLACNSIAPNSIYGLTAALLTTGLDFVLISLSYWLILRTVFRLPSREAWMKAFGTCGAHICVILIFYTLAFFSFFTHRFGNHVPRHTLILLANLYLLVPPIMNPIVYGVKTKEIRV